jgi:hypothetical protein
MKTISEIAGSITLRYGHDEFEGDELDMVRAAVTAALIEDRENLARMLEDEKEVPNPDFPRPTEDFNGGISWAQRVIREVD